MTKSKKPKATKAKAEVKYITKGGKRLRVAYFGSGTKLKKLSNFYRGKLKYEGRTYGSTEHAYQATYRVAEAHRHKLALPDGALSGLQGLELIYPVKAEAKAKTAWWGSTGLTGIVAKQAVHKSRAARLGLVLIRQRDDPNDIEEIKRIFRELLLQKYETHEGPREELLGTGDDYLVEFARMAVSEAKRGKPPLFTGQVKDGELFGDNLMGELLMETREVIRSKAAAR